MDELYHEAINEAINETLKEAINEAIRTAGIKVALCNPHVDFKTFSAYN